ncbi:DUF2793 domain-containing protein [Aurantimonas aggregata]|uniref:DUF2793 domain-containing protein n=1 Tax=Aurantimonas aggregata TaxID=2047720 RepID=A0A6L9MM59_9HYPH|nr:phage tail protein [Aurantimonas aggregata]NDV88805.1 DUF2793 domain-containing protein [Aurantimonas aggregata]
MAQISYALITTVGAQKIAAALAAETSINLVSIAIGSGATAPSGGETALYSEVARKSISGQGVVAGALNTLYADIYLAAADGPYTITEAGLFDDTGALIAIARVNPAINKPIPSSGQVVEGTLRIQIQVANATAVAITVDPSMAVALQRLSVLPWIPVISVTTAAPPASPAIGDTYVIPTGATGSWAGHANKVAEFTSAGWALITPRNGVGVGLPDGRVFMRLSGVFTELVASETRKGLVELATRAEALAGASQALGVHPLGLTDARRKMEYVTAGGTANALTVTLDPAPTELYIGMSLRVRVTAQNTGAVTLNVNGLGAQNVSNSNAPFTLQSGAIPPTAILELVYAGGSGWFVIGGLQATANSLGDVKLASNTDAQTGMDAEKALTPAALSSRTATETRTGLVELATAAEVVAGTDASRGITPASLLARTATETRIGLVELATPAETAAMADLGRAVTPGGLKEQVRKIAKGLMIVYGPGTHVWVCPDDVTLVRVYGRGGGGGGGGCSNASWAASGGSGAAYFDGVYPVVPGTSYAIVVGAAGAAAPAGSPGGNGGLTSFASFASAPGGIGAPAGSGSPNSTVGPGFASGGQVNMQGGVGGTGTLGGPQGGVGGGSFNISAVNLPPIGGGGGIGGLYPGLGGNGAGGVNTGGAGGPGQLILEY